MTNKNKTKPEAEKAKKVEVKLDEKSATQRTPAVAKAMAGKQKSTEGTEKAKAKPPVHSESSQPKADHPLDEVSSVLQKKHPKAGQPIKEKQVKTSPKLATIIQDIEKLSVLELADLVKALEEKFGVVAAAPVAAPVSAPVQATTQAPKIEEKSEFDVVLTAVGANKIAAIKAVREIKPDIGLKEAKDLVEAAPGQVLKRADKKTAEEAKKKLEAAGCQVELK